MTSDGNSGRDLKTTAAGIRRSVIIQTIINAGRRVGTRIMTAWILIDLDNSGIMKKGKYNPPQAPSYLDPEPVDNSGHKESNRKLMDLIARQMRPTSSLEFTALLTTTTQSAPREKSASMQN